MVRLALCEALTKQQGALFLCRLATLTGLNSPSGNGPTSSRVPGAIIPLTSSPPKTGSSSPTTLKNCRLIF